MDSRLRQILFTLLLCLSVLGVSSAKPQGQASEGKAFYIFGGVRYPGSYVSNVSDLKLQLAIKIAGGLTEGLRSKSFLILRPNSNGGRPQILRVNFEAIVEGTQEDFKLMDGDTIIVHQYCVPIQSK